MKQLPLIIFLLLCSTLSLAQPPEWKICKMDSKGQANGWTMLPDEVIQLGPFTNQKDISLFFEPETLINDEDASRLLQVELLDKANNIDEIKIVTTEEINSYGIVIKALTLKKNQTLKLQNLDTMPACVSYYDQTESKGQKKYLIPQ